MANTETVKIPRVSNNSHVHPGSVAQVGDFYETMGIDAVMLVQYAGLNPMGVAGKGKGSPPRAGCPKVNIHRTLCDLVQAAGLSVVRIEQ